MFTIIVEQNLEIDVCTFQIVKEFFFSISRTCKSLVCDELVCVKDITQDYKFTVISAYCKQRFVFFPNKLQ